MTSRPGGWRAGVLLATALSCSPLFAGEPAAYLHIARSRAGWSARPLDTLTVSCHGGVLLVARDGSGHEYFRGPAGQDTGFLVGGALGSHTLSLLDEGGSILDEISFEVDAETTIEDEGGRFSELNEILLRTMRSFARDRVGSTEFRGNRYHWFVMWILDHANTAKGMQYYEPHTAGLVDLLREGQREDGMIWSNVNPDSGPGYFDNAYGPYGYCRRAEGVRWTRQPVENHCEYDYVDAMHRAWQGSGDDAWMAAGLDSAMRALDYTMNDRARWSEKYQLLKRGYTIDSWDFQVVDQYSVEFPLGTKQNIDPERTRFGVFFGDNTGYAHGCDQLAEMLEAAGRSGDAARYRQRGREIRERLAALAWNGRFYTHHVTEDPDVVRDLGVDDQAQIAMSNAYSINRGISHEKSVAIIETYRDLRANLPEGSPGEWYAIYPPFGRGFGEDGEKWQYMNGGVHGHAAGELARGAFEHGFEDYGADILLRLRRLAKQHSGLVRFAYTGATLPAPPPQTFTPLDISQQANMDLWDQGGEGVPPWMSEAPGNDMRNLPVGEQTFAGVPYLVPTPGTNGRRGAIAVALHEGYPERVELPLGRTAGAVYLVHTSHRLDTEANTAAGVAGALSFEYEDGTVKSLYIRANTHLHRWWYPELKAQDAGIAWRGPNPLSTDVGVSWAAITNPSPDKTIRNLVFSASLSEAIYAVMGVTLADRPPYHAPDPESFGGPDNWAGGTCMLALLEGLAGVRDAATAYKRVRLSPRWSAADVDDVAVTARYAASQGYVSYRYEHDEEEATLRLLLTGSGDDSQVRLLLPRQAKSVEGVWLDGEPIGVKLDGVEGSRYAVVPTQLARPARIELAYAR